MPLSKARRWQLLLLLMTTFTGSVMSLVPEPPVTSMRPIAIERLLRRVDMTTCGTHTDTSLDCCQDQGPFFCPIRFGSCYTSLGYIGCCSRSDGCLPRTTCYPHSALQDCDPDTGGCTACTNQASPECVLETNVLANQYLLYCNTAKTTITHSYTLNQAELAREESEKSSWSSRSSASAAAAAAASKTASASQTAQATSSGGSSTARPGSGSSSQTVTQTSSASSTSTQVGAAAAGGSSSNGGNASNASNGSNGSSANDGTPANASGSKSNGGLIGGIVGGLAAFVVILVGAYFVWQRKKSRFSERTRNYGGIPSPSVQQSSSSNFDNQASPYSWARSLPTMSNSGYQHISHPYTGAGGEGQEPPRGWNGSPGPDDNVMRYSYQNYGDPQHPGYYPIGPLTVRNRGVSPVPPEDDEKRIEGGSLS